jgi:hypothetical protein
MSDTKIDGDKWSTKETASLHNIAVRLFRCEWPHTQTDSDLLVDDAAIDERGECGACVLRGYLSSSAMADDMTAFDGPNYAGWARVYVEARKPIPSAWREAFESERNSDNKLYAEALERSIKTFGVSYEQ